MPKLFCKKDEVIYGGNFSGVVKKLQVLQRFSNNPLTGYSVIRNIPVEAGLNAPGGNITCEGWICH